MYEPFEIEEYKGYEIKLYNDYDSEDPRKWENLGTMVCNWNRYTLGDVQEDLTCHLECLLDVDQDSLYWETGDYEEKLWKRFEKFYFWLPLYIYEHGGITMNTGGFHCRWDSGQAGIIYVSKKDARENWGWKNITKEREKEIYDLLRSEVETYDKWLCGEVMGYEVEKEGEPIDGCWGFYEKEDVMEAAKDIIHYRIEQEKEKVMNLIDNSFKLNAKYV
jgi:hypothetical protein